MELSLDDLGLVHEEIFVARAKWYDIGLPLKVRVHNLESTESQSSDPRVCLREILKVWLKTAGTKTWKTLVDALRSKTVDESKLALRLVRKYSVETLVKVNEEQACQMQDLNKQVNGLQTEIQQLQARAQHELESRERQLQAKDCKIQEKDEALAARQKEIEELRLEQHAREAEKSPVTKKRRQNEDLHLQSREQSQAKDTRGIQGKFNWKELLNVPEGLRNVSSAIIDGKMVYVSDGCKMYAYDLDKMEWNIQQECPHYLFSLAVVKGRLTTIGGCNETHQSTKSLLSLTERSIGRAWSEHFPPMEIARIKPAVACSAKALIVAGGYTTSSMNSHMDTHVEVMNTWTKKWFTASRQLRKEWCTITIAKDILYIYTATPPKIIACCITNLLQLGSSQDDICVWYEISCIVAIKPNIVTVREQLMAISEDEANTNVHLYDSKNDSWEVIITKLQTWNVDRISEHGLILVEPYDRPAIFIPDFE